jgi:hypothetical protein
MFEALKQHTRDLQARSGDEGELRKTTSRFGGSQNRLAGVLCRAMWVGAAAGLPGSVGVTIVDGVIDAVTLQPHHAVLIEENDGRRPVRSAGVL